MDEPTYYSLHRDEMLAYNKAYNHRFRDEKKQYYKMYYQKNKERLAENRKIKKLKDIVITPYIRKF